MSSLLDKLEEIKLPVHGEFYKDFLDEGGVVISPSGLRNLIESPSSWKSNVIDKVKTFTGNEKTQVGDYVHLYAEYFYKGKLTKEDRLPSLVKEAFFRENQLINLNSFLDKKKTIKMSNYLDTLCDVLRDEYLEMYIRPEESEGYIELKLDDKTMLAGSYDALSYEDKDIVVIDFKTSGSSLNEKSMINYILQLSIYCRALEITRDIKPTKIRICGIIKNMSPKVQILECKPNYELASKIVTQAYNAIRFERGEDLTKEELYDLIFRENIYSFTMEDSDIKKIIGEVTISTGTERKVKSVVKNIFG
jgi:hypothetical protein